MQALPLTRNSFALEELVALSTCNRFEIYAVARRSLQISDFLRLMNHLLVAADLAPLEDLEELAACCYLLVNRPAVGQLFKVASSLDSLILGETQITGQFKKFFTLASQVKTLGRFLDRMGQDALAVTKKVRTDTALGRKTVSISHAAIDLATKVYKDLAGRRLLFIGAGEMTRLAAKYALRYKPSEIVICNRSVARAEALVQELGAGIGIGLEKLELVLSKAEVVVVATNSRQVLVSYEMVRTLRRSGQALFICDISMPRNVDPRIGELDDVYLFEIDDLQKMVQKNVAAREIEAQKALDMIDGAVEKYFDWLAQAANKPVIETVRHYVEELCQRELEKTLAKQALSGLGDGELDALRLWGDSVSSKLVGDIARKLNSAELAFCRQDLARSLEIVFDRR